MVVHTLRRFLFGEAVGFCCSRIPSVGPMLLLRPFRDTLTGEDPIVLEGETDCRFGDRFSLFNISAIVSMLALYNVCSKKMALA